MAVGVRDTVDGADDLRREVRVERDRRADRSTSNPQLNALIAPTAAAKDLIGLAGRMGIPTEDAVRCVLKHLSDRHPLAAAVVEQENGDSGSGRARGRCGRNPSGPVAACAGRARCSAVSSAGRNRPQGVAMTLRDELLTPAEAAQMLRVEVKTVSGLARAGKLSAVRNLAGDVRFRTSDVVQFKDARAGQGE